MLSAETGLAIPTIAGGRGPRGYPEASAATHLLELIQRRSNAVSAKHCSSSREGKGFRPHGRTQQGMNAMIAGPVAWAAAGVVINLLSARLFGHNHHHDLNQRAAVLLSAIALGLTGWLRLDAITAIGIRRSTLQLKHGVH